MKKKASFVSLLGIMMSVVLLSLLLLNDESNISRGSRLLRNGWTVRRNRTSNRNLSINKGGGDCEWTGPSLDIEGKDYYKTLFVGYPSGDKRITWAQAEALMGLPTKDDRAFEAYGYSNEPFIKTNYPHPAGIWSWGNAADSVILVVQYMRNSMVEYGNMEHYRSRSLTRAYWDVRETTEELYGENSPLEEFYTWRDEKVWNEIFKYGWYIDYWMEAGLFRDPYSHQLIDADYWAVWQDPPKINDEKEKVTVCHRTFSKKNPWVTIEISINALETHLNHGDIEGDCPTDLPTDELSEEHFVHDHAETSDPRCSDVSGGCRPVAVISSDYLIEGPDETARLASILMNNEKMSSYMIDAEAWDCIWEEVILNDKGPATFKNRDYREDRNFSAMFLQEMMDEVSRIITKYSSGEWSSDPAANRLVSILSDHMTWFQTELDEVVSGRRILTVSDFHHPIERKRMLTPPTTTTTV